MLGTYLAGETVKAADLSAPKEIPPEAQVDTSKVFGMALGVRLQSDYIFRGISQSNHEPSLQTYWEMQLVDNFLYAGFATYKTDLPTRPTIEQDLTAGIRPKLGPLPFDLGVIFYNYPNERRLFGPDRTILTPANTDFLVFAGKVSYTYQDALTLGANVFHEGIG